jgi:hypothetical protein
MYIGVFIRPTHSTHTYPKEEYDNKANNNQNFL